MTARELWCRLAGLWRKEGTDADLAEEMASHIELAKADYISRGMSEAEAARLAAARFGPIASAREHVWEQRRLPGFAPLAQDAHYAARGMRRSPVFTVVTVTTLALGIGMCSVIYSLLNGIFLRPVPGVPEPERLVTTQNPVPYPWFESIRDQGKGTWRASAFIAPVPMSVAAGSHADRVWGALVSPEYFETLGVQPLRGRFFDKRNERAAVAVVTERFWRMHMGGDPRAIGRTLRVNGRAVPVIGVGPRAFHGAATGAFVMPEVFLPATAGEALAPELRDDALRRTKDPAFRVLMRIAPGVTAAAAEARLDTQLRGLDTHNEHKGRLARLLPSGSVLVLPKEAKAVVLAYYVVLVLSILGLTCANLGGLMLARGAARGREFAIRMSIGADRFRLVRQLLTECGMLAVVGGLGGYVAATALYGLMLRMAVDNPLFEGQGGPDVRVAAFTFAVSTLAAIGFGLLPALAVTRPGLANVMKAGSAGALRSHRVFGLRNLFVIGQVAAAMVLMLVMGFFVLGVRRGVEEPGFDVARVSFFSVDPVRDGLSRRECAEVLRQIPERMARASLSDRPPLASDFAGTVVQIASGKQRSVAIERVGPHYFATIGVAMLRGAEFDARSAQQKNGAIPVILNHVAARNLFGDADALGQRIRWESRVYQVTGVVRYSPRELIQTRGVPVVFVPLTPVDAEQNVADGVIVVMRTRGPMDVAALRRELAKIDPRLTLFHPRTLIDYMAELDRAASFMSGFYLPIGVFGLVLACLGIAGVTAQGVERRKKEIGIRVALGAERGQLLRLVMRDAVAMVAVGAVLGYAASVGLVRLLCAIFEPMARLLGGSVSSPALVAGIPLVLVTLAAVACWVPARHSASVDPLVSLREE